MTHHSTLRNWVLALALGAGSSTFAQVSFNIVFAPPEPLYEEVPAMPPGFVWAPGYWAWHENHHIWVRGRYIVQRPGYRWVPDRWEQRGGFYIRQPGRWEHDMNPPPGQIMKLQKPKHDNGHRKNNKRRKDERKNQRGNGH